MVATTSPPFGGRVTENGSGGRGLNCTYGDFPVDISIILDYKTTAVWFERLGPFSYLLLFTTFILLKKIIMAAAN